MRKILDPKNLPYAGALVQAVLFSLAGQEQFGAYGWLLGAGVGMVVNYSLALASSRVSEIAQKRKTLAYSSLFLLACLSPVIICSTLGWNLANFSWSVGADLAIVLAGATAGKSLISQSEPLKPAKRKPAKAKTAKRTASEIKCPNADYGCSHSGSQNSINAHVGKCKFAPRIALKIEKVDAKGKS